MPPLDHRACYQVISRKDSRFDGRFYTGVTSTGIFCRPSCPARTPRSDNVRFFGHAAAAAEAGFRPCRRCRPELAPGHPEWNRRADLAGKALALIEQGVVDQHGVSGLASRLGVSERHLRRELKEEVGTGPIQLARARRLWLARLLLDQTRLPVTDVAFASGFSSVRQFNDAFRQTFDATPSSLRRSPAAPSGRSRRADDLRSAAERASGARGHGDESSGTEISLRLSGRGPVGWDRLHGFLSARAIDGLEQAEPGRFRRGVPGGWIELEGDADADRSLHLHCSLDRLDRLADIVSMVRAVADLDTDLEPIADHLGQDPDLAARLATTSLPRLPGCFDRFEVAVRAVVGQQVSVAGARTLLGRLVELAAPTEGTNREPDPARPPELRAGFPTPEQIAAAPLEHLGMPNSRRDTLRRLAEAVACGDVDLSTEADRGEVAERLLAVKGIGPWTAGYISMRALADPDGWPTNDLVLKKSLGLDGPTLEARAMAWKPWRAYAALLLWSAPPTEPCRRQGLNDKA